MKEKTTFCPKSCGIFEQPRIVFDLTRINKMKEIEPVSQPIHSFEDFRIFPAVWFSSRMQVRRHAMVGSPSLPSVAELSCVVIGKDRTTGRRRLLECRQN